MYDGNEGRPFLDGHLIPGLEDNALLTCAGMVRSDLRHLRHFAFSITSGFNRTVIYRDKEYENINDIFPNDYGASKINFIKSLVVYMMGHLSQLDEICILPTRQQFYRGNECWEMAPSMRRTYSIRKFPPECSRCPLSTSSNSREETDITFGSASMRGIVVILNRILVQYYSLA
ncbi:hypothetical protein H9Q72_003274 [Fusarium xylarioides]|uniref:Uncharacterized protein n=1 Tax=Fusarium xylarioides TaxID=221167 RepID=A0A9P7LMS0_9HYPO|nr:hypothetical protein H9Q70_005278 [Fusarium xylarioides]KAG5769470.1 hypothetical protein H9Q72_003274 [Fusarium xylarioides]KAG5808367.1 hypothetical protein H9Q71_007116 [Fusarium xylarioides]KAG5823538.1 hypothetical protein H9Q74_006376 [Fusarium xylarioides]